MVYEAGGKAWQVDDKRGVVFLQKDWDGSSLPNEIVEQAGLLGAGFKNPPPLERAGMGGYEKIGDRAVFLVEPRRFPMLLQQAGTPVFLASEWNGWEDAKKHERWQLTPEGDRLCLWMDWEDLLDLGSFAFKFVTGDGVWLDPPDSFPGVEENEAGSVNFLFDPQRTGKDLVTFQVLGSKTTQNLSSLLDTRPKGEFGYRVVDGNAEFRVYAPRAKQVELEFYSSESLESEGIHPLSFEGEGCWQIKLPGNRSGSLYRYVVTHHDYGNPKDNLVKKILDPYALATRGRNGPGIALLPGEKIEKPFSPPSMAELVIVETHLRDLLKKAPTELNQNERMEFRGLTKWLGSKDCYLRTLGANAVELQPVLEFDSKSKEEYHWGYMPVNFFSPSSDYAGNPRDGSVIGEFKDLIAAFHDAGMAVIIDVVYNHVGIPNHLAFLDRELYFSTDEMGRLTNHSGCGNDLNCESEAARKLVLDSVCHLVKTFDVDGFRFDLGELLGIELLSEIEKELREIKPGIILIAEPWSFRGRLPREMNQTGYSLWSDACREKILHFVKEPVAPRAALDLLQGRLDDENLRPWQSVNYLESHDDYAFVDRLCHPDDWVDGVPPRKIIAQARFALGLLLLAPGVPMLSAGQDFMRGKKGVRNTYLRGDLNALDYSRTIRFEEFGKWIRSLIAFRLSNEGRFLRPERYDELLYEEINLSDGKGFGLLVRNAQDGSRSLILANPSDCAIPISTPLRDDLDEAKLLFGDPCEPASLGPLQIQAWRLRE